MSKRRDAEADEDANAASEAEVVVVAPRVIVIVFDRLTEPKIAGGREGKFRAFWW